MPDRSQPLRSAAAACVCTASRSRRSCSLLAMAYKGDNRSMRYCANSKRPELPAHRVASGRESAGVDGSAMPVHISRPLHNDQEFRGGQGDLALRRSLASVDEFFALVNGLEGIFFHVPVHGAEDHRTIVKQVVLVAIVA